MWYSVSHLHPKGYSISDVRPDLTDPYHCDALANRGTWLDAGKRNWQPDGASQYMLLSGLFRLKLHNITGCMLNQYNAKQAAGCLHSRDVVFIGDSVTRKLFFQFGHILDPSLPTAPADDGKKHSDHALVTANGTRVLFYWDPFLNGTSAKDLLAVNHGSQVTPGLLVMGSGLWYLRYAATSGGIPAWEENMDTIFNNLVRSKRPVADTVVMLPVEQVATPKLSPDRSSTMHPSDIDAMNSDLFHRINPISSPVPLNQEMSIHLPLVFNKMLDPASTEDGVHYSDYLVHLQATILLNLRCNDALPKQFPFSKTCCNKYPTPNIAHMVILGLLLVSVLALCYLATTGGQMRNICRCMILTSEQTFKSSSQFLRTRSIPRILP